MIRGLPGAAALIVSSLLMAACGDDPTGSLVRHPPVDATVLASVDPGVWVKLETIDGEGNASWLTEEGLFYARGGKVVELPFWARWWGRRSVFLHPGGSLMSLEENPRMVSLWRNGTTTWQTTSRSFYPVGFTDDGRPWIVDTGTQTLLVGDEHGDFVDSGRPVGSHIAPDGTILIDGVGQERCALDRGGTRASISPPGLPCTALDVASGGRALVHFGGVPHIWEGTRIVSVDELEWEVPKPSDLGTLVLLGINRFGDAVGVVRHVPVLVRGGAVRPIEALDAPDDGWVWLDVGDINDQGQVLALGRNDAGETAVAILALGR